MTRRDLSKLSLFAAAAILVAAAFAQDRTASMSGTVHDPSGAPVPGAKVIITNTETGIKRVADSSSSGDYTVTLLEPGSYEATVEHAGFQTYVQSGIVLHVDDSVKLDFSLQLGQVSQVIDVHEDVALLHTGDSALGQVVDNEKVLNLPLNGRSSFRLVELTPGFIPTDAAEGQFLDIPVNTTWDSNFSINGSQGYSNEIMIDGSPSTTGFFDQITTMPSVDALVEFKVQSSSMSAEFGRFGGGVINVTTKSGTNRFHGALYEFVRNDVWDANDFFSNRAGSAKPPFRMNQFGGSLGGPVEIPKLYNGHNRTFFFANYEGTRWRRGAVYIDTVPTAAQREGNFTLNTAGTGKGAVIYNPFSTAPNASGAEVRTAFPGNIIPASMISPIGSAMASYYPLPNLPSLSNGNNFISNAPTAIDKGQETFRLDHQITDLQKIFARVSLDNTDLCQPNYFGNVASPTPGTVGCTTWRNRSASLEYDNILSPQSILTVRYGFARWYQLRTGLSYGFDQTTLGFPSSLVSQEQVPMFPSISNGTYAGLGNQTQLFLSNGNDTHSLLPSITLMRGKHSLKAGADVRLTRINIFNPDAPAGAYSFTAAFTQGPNPLSNPGGGNALASMLLGTVQSGRLTTDSGASLQNFYYAGYVQDDIKLTRRLTINAGLRYETESPYTERRNRLVGFDPNLASPAANPAFPNLTGGLVFASASNRSVYDWYKNGFSPRLGFAWQAARNFVVRGGAGIFYAPLQISNNAVGFTPSSGFSSSTPFIASADGGLTPYNTLGTAFSSGLVPLTGNSLGAATFLGQGITVWDAHPIMPRSYQWNFDVQRQLPWSVLIDAAYVGNRGAHLAGSREFDALPTQDLAAGSPLLNMVANPFYGKISTGTLALPTVTAESLLTPFPQFSSVNIINDTFGDSTYHALQVKGEKRLSSGLSFLVSYTFEKIITDVPWAVSTIGSNNGSGTYQDWYNLRAERALSAQDIPQLLAVSFNYALPFGKGRHFGSSWHGPASWILGNWGLNGLAKYRSGKPLALSTSVNNTHSLGGGSRPSTTGESAVLSDPTVDKWFNTSVFKNPAPFTYGNVSRTINVFSPDLVNLDTSLVKNAAIRERLHLQFRAEAFNVLNHPNFRPPDSTLGSGTFGQISAMSTLPRVGQLALKLTF